jgi:SPP1 family phage portal protein
VVTIKTYQDYEKADDKLKFIVSAINEYRAGEEYRTALLANDYERQRNTTINQYMRYLYTQTGQKAVDFTAANNKLASNFFHRLNTDRCAYSLGNGVSFTNTEKRVENGQEKTIDLTKEALGSEFDTDLYKAAYYALIHGVSYTRWEDGKAYVFTADEFCPLYDEYTGELRAGIRFWSLDWEKRPATVVLYTEEGYTVYRTKDGSRGLDIAEYQPQRAYKVQVQETVADGAEIVGESNYGSLPIIPLWGSKHHQSTLVGLRPKIDAYDLIQSGFANDLEECAEIYWIISNAMGMDDSDLAKFRDRLKLNHIAVADTDNTGVTPYTNPVPTEARKVFLDNIRASIYEDFGALDVHTISAGATNDHIDAGYQPMDEEADDFEYQIIQYVRRVLQFMNIDDTPQFKRNKISNLKEQTEVVMLAAEYLDDETILQKLPFVTVDEVNNILMNKSRNEAVRFSEEEELPFGGEQ